MIDETNNSHQDTPNPLTLGELIALQEAAEYAGLMGDSLQGNIRRGRLRAKNWDLSG